MAFSDPHNWGKEEEGPEGGNAHHRPRSQAQRDHKSRKESRPDRVGWWPRNPAGHRPPGLPELAAHRPFDLDVYPRNDRGRH